jgi:hypothetical protein
MAQRQDEWLPFLSQLAGREDSRKSALESRATGLAAISASIIAVLTAGSVIGARTGNAVPNFALIVVAIALVLFVASIVSCVVANLPARLRQTDPAALLSRLRESASESDTSVWTTIAATHVAEYNSLCSANQVKTMALWIGLTCQILGCVALAIFVLNIL